MNGTRIHVPTTRKQGEMLKDERGHFVGFKDPNIVYIGRRFTRGGYDLPKSPWQNPYSVKRYGRKRAVALYREHILNSSPTLLSRLDELEGKILACWCTPGELCHGDVLLELLEARTE